MELHTHTYTYKLCESRCGCCSYASSLIACCCCHSIWLLLLLLMASQIIAAYYCSCVFLLRFANTCTAFLAKCCKSTLRRSPYHFARAHNTHTHTHERTNSFSISPNIFRACCACANATHWEVNYCRQQTHTHIHVRACVYVSSSNVYLCCHTHSHLRCFSLLWFNLILFRCWVTWASATQLGCLLLCCCWCFNCDLTFPCSCFCISLLFSAT